MNRNQVVVLVVALACVGGLALAAATVSTPSSDQSGGGSGGGSDSGQDTVQPSETEDQESSNLPRPVIYFAMLLTAIAFLIALRLFADALNLRRIVVIVLVAAILLAVSILVLSAIVDLQEFAQEDSSGVGTTTGTGNGTGNGSDQGRTPTETPTRNTDLPVVLFGVFGVIVLVLAVLVYRYSGSDTGIEVAPESDDVAETGSVQAVGEAAGRAADRLDAEVGSVENAIYQAWVEMTDALDVEHPQTTTPEEFADHAIDAGMAPDDVRELTTLFEEVRYGDTPVTEDREQRAEAALRRIQDAYAEDETDV